ncbi:MAG: protein translocase subunit SecD [Phycisphaerales bacterium]|jgi:SecD/SecF fusion protein
MKRTLAWKFALIAVATALAILMLQAGLKPGLDLAGGTSLIYEIDTHGIPEKDQKGLAQNMITVLRRRIDPANIQNLLWRPHGNTRFEIQMPLASKEAREKRENYEAALNEILSQNINTAKIMRSLAEPAEQRTKDFNDFSGGYEQRKEILDNLADAYDQLQAAREQRDALAEKLTQPEQLIESAGLDLDEVQTSVGYWITVEDANQQSELIKAFLGDDYSQQNLNLLLEYTRLYADWSKVADELTDPVEGKNILYKETVRQLNQLSLTEDQLKVALDMAEGSIKRSVAIDELKEQFPDRSELIDKVVAAFDEYRPFQGRLDDPKDLQRMLKGAGILEFRILPTIGQADSDTELLETYVQNLKEKGPKFASDSKYVWCPVEDVAEWVAQNPTTGQLGPKITDKDNNPSVIGSFGGKFYVLASNKSDETMLHQPEKKPWKLKKARPTQDQQGRRVIGFSFDDRAANIFGKLTGNNLKRPLCILLDGMAISAPTINSRITSEGIIQGRFSKEEVDDMVNKLNAGSLPAMLIEQPISIKSIGPSIGADNRDDGIKAGLIGLIVVIACMLAYYLSAGATADVALLLNILIVLAAMAWLRATFTLPGIAGLILTIGMSVDANVLIFERIREEQQKGSSLRIAIKNGYQKAFRTIFDANLTTFITAAILFWVAPEEVKGFAIVLMLGIVTSMFTALFVTRAIFDLLLEFGIIKQRMVMFQLIKNPRVNWMALRPVMLTISAILISAGLFVFFTRDDSKNNKYDIEFTGGTSVQVNLKEPVHIQLVRDRIQRIGQELNNPALAAANVYSIGQLSEEQTTAQFEINTTETNKTVAKVTFASNPTPAIEDVRAKIQKAQQQTNRKLTNLLITPDQQNPNILTVATSQLNKSVVKEVLSIALPDANVAEPELDEIVNEAVLTAFADLIEIRRSLRPHITAEEKITEPLAEESPELLDYLGGIKITCKLDKPTSGDEIQRRFKDLRFKPEMRDLDWYAYRLYTDKLQPLGTDDKQIDSFVYASAQPEAGARELSEDEWNRFLKEERTKVLAATKLEESLPRVTQVNPSVGAEAKTQALIAIVLSLCAIIGYIWVRFGSFRYGLAAIAALVHDVCITLGAVAACTYIASTSIGETLLIGDFKISQVIIAAFLTLIGYSLNDTIVVFDRIRENRRKAQLVPQTITNSINQTISRTILTSFTTFVVVLIMYIFGGQNLRGFTFAIGLGIIIGTYSSVAIAAPLLLLGTKIPKQQSN